MVVYLILFLCPVEALFTTKRSSFTFAFPMSAHTMSVDCHLCHCCSTFMYEALEEGANLNEFLFPNSASMLRNLSVP